MNLRQAVLLVGGRGTRVWPLTAEAPKALLPVAGLPFIEYQIRLVASAGVEDVILAVGQDHLEVWKDYVAAWDSSPSLSLAIEEEPLNTAGPVVEAIDRLDDRFLVLNGDVVLEADLSTFVAAAPEQAAATIALVTVDDPSAYGVVVTDSEHMVEAFVEKPPPGTEPTDTVNAGIYVLRRSALEEYPRGPLSFERVVFPRLAERRDLGGIVVSGSWLDIGTPDLLLATNGYVLTGSSPLYRPDRPHLSPDEAGGRRAGAWSWVGEGAAIGEEAVVEEALVFPGARIGGGAEIRNAVVGAGATVEPGAVVTGASLVGSGATVGAGCEIDAGMRVAPGANLQPGSVTFRPPQ